MSEGTKNMEQAQAVDTTSDAFIGDHAARAAALRDKYAHEPSSSVNEGSEDSEGAAEESSEDGLAQPPAGEALEGAAARAAEREKRMLAYREKERAARAERERKRAAAAEREAGLRAQAEVERAREEARKEREAREQLEAQLKDPAALFSLAERHRIPPEEWGAYLGKINDPVALAAEAAKKATTPEIQAIREEIAALKAEREREAREAQARAEAHAERAAVERFLAHVQGVADDAPVANAYLREFGAEQFGAYANAMFKQYQPETAQELIDIIETELGRFGRVAGAQGSIRPSNNGKQETPRNAAAKASSTLTNRDAQARTTVTEEPEDWALPVEERVERLKRRHGLG